MPLTIATWNINSVRLRMPLVAKFLAEYQPDLLCLQETKCPDELFPQDEVRALGYRHIAFHGQKGYHGVATFSKRPIETIEKREFCKKGDSRHLSVRFEAGGKPVLLHNFYVPAGGDEPDPEINPKFRHKLDFIAEMHGLPADTDTAAASSTLSSGQASGAQAASATAVDCGGADNTTVSITVPSANVAAVPAGSYSDTLTLLVTPQ